MVNLKIRLDAGAIAPHRAHPQDAGLDLYAREAKEIPPGGSCNFGTGVHMLIPDGWCGLLVARSGLNAQHSLTSTGLIDAGYTGEIRVKLYNHGTRPYPVAAGDRISQIVILPCMVCGVEIVPQGGALAETDRGEDGFGSSGR